MENLTEYRNPPWHGVAAGDSLPRSFMELGNMKLMIEAFTLGKMFVNVGMVALDFMACAAASPLST